jgi:hypothetical protein
VVAMRFLHPDDVHQAMRLASEATNGSGAPLPSTMHAHASVESLPTQFAADGKACLRKLMMSRGF